MDFLNNLRGQQWFSEIPIILFFVFVYLFQKISETEKFLRWWVKAQPDNYDAHLKLGLFLIEKESSYDETVAEFNRAILVNPQRVDAYHQLYLLQDSRKNTAEADKILSILLALFPNDALAYIWKGMDLRETDEKIAEEFFLKAIALAPHFPFAFEKYGYFLLQQERYAEAENISYQAIENGVISNAIFRNFIQSLLAQRKYTEAVTEAKKFVKLQPNDVALWFDLGRSLSLSENFDGSAEIFNKVILKSPKWVDAHYFLGISYSGTSYHEKAVESFCKVIELDPNNHKAYECLADGYCSLKRFVEAEAAYRKAIELNQKDPVLYQDLGRMFYQISRYKDAEEVYREGISKTSKNAYLFLNLALLLEKMGRDLEAENCYHEAIKKAPSLAISHTRLASLLCKTNQVAEAAAVLEEFIRSNPEKPEGYLSLASQKRQLSEYIDLDVLSKARNLIPTDSWYNLACLESISGSSELALDYLRQAVSTLDFEVAWAWEDPDLQWIRDDPRFIEIVGQKPED